MRARLKCMSVRSRLKTAVNKAVKEGTIDKKKQGAIIEAAMKLAAVLDDPDWPIIDKRFDNVTPSTFLKYCEMLHLTPGDITTDKANGEAGLIGNSRWKKTDADES